MVETVPAADVKLAVVAPPGTVTTPGTPRAAVLLDSITAAPPDPAEFESVTTQVETPPEARVVGAHASDIKAGGAESSVKDCVWELPFTDAVTAAVWLVEMVPAAAVKFADAAPDATVTEAGTVSAALLLERATVTPAAPAACDSVTAHTDVPPELRLVGAHDTKLTKTGATSEIEAVCELPL